MGILDIFAEPEPSLSSCSSSDDEEYEELRDEPIASANAPPQAVPCTLLPAPVHDAALIPKRVDGAAPIPEPVDDAALNPKPVDDGALTPKPPRDPFTRPTLSAPTAASAASAAVVRLRAAKAAIEAARAAAALPPPVAQAKPAIRRADWQDWQHNTSFFRDGTATWDAVADRILFGAARAAMLAAQRRPRPVRVWSCGCSSGEELFTARLAYEQWVVPTFVAVYGFAPAFCGVGTDRSTRILQAAQDERRTYSLSELAEVRARYTEA